MTIAHKGNALPHVSHSTKNTIYKYIYRILYMCIYIYIDSYIYLWVCLEIFIEQMMIWLHHWSWKGGGFVWEHYTVDFEIDWETGRCFQRRFSTEVCGFVWFVPVRASVSYLDSYIFFQPWTRVVAQPPVVA